MVAHHITLPSKLAPTLPIRTDRALTASTYLLPDTELLHLCFEPWYTILVVINLGSTAARKCVQSYKKKLRYARGKCGFTVKRRIFHLKTFVLRACYGRGGTFGYAQIRFGRNSQSGGRNRQIIGTNAERVPATR